MSSDRRKRVVHNHLKGEPADDCPHCGAEDRPGNINPPSPAQGVGLRRWLEREQGRKAA